MIIIIAQVSGKPFTKLKSFLLELFCPKDIF